jgi:hypothetical protein
VLAPPLRKQFSQITLSASLMMHRIDFTSCTHFPPQRRKVRQAVAWCVCTSQFSRRVGGCWYTEGRGQSLICFFLLLLAGNLRG